MNETTGQEATTAEAGRVDPVVRPVAWIAKAENGNIRCWASAPEEALRLAREIGFDLQPLYSQDALDAATNAEREVCAKLHNVVGLAYGHLWLVNNEPGTPHRYPPERAAYEARKLLRDTMTHEQRGEFINRVIANAPDIEA